MRNIRQITVLTFSSTNRIQSYRLESGKSYRDLISSCWYNPQPMRNDHSIAGTTILQTTLEDADSTQFYWWLDKSGGKGSSLDFKTFRCSTPSSVGSHERKSRYYQHLLVSFEELLSLRLSDHFALVVGCINNNWLNLWKKDACEVFTGISPPLWKAIEIASAATRVV